MGLVHQKMQTKPWDTHYLRKRRQLRVQGWTLSPPPSETDLPDPSILVDSALDRDGWTDKLPSLHLLLINKISPPWDRNSPGWSRLQWKTPSGHPRKRVRSDTCFDFFLNISSYLKSNLNCVSPFPPPWLCLPLCLLSDLVCSCLPAASS